MLAEDENATELSLVENAIREDMHPDDQCAAFAALAEQGMSLEDIAARFGVTPTVVKQRLRLAAVAPALRARYRDGELNLAQMMAFALVDDHAQQEAVWGELSEWNRSPETIRRALTSEGLSAEHRLARFVGLEAYEAAGGVVLRNLFEDEPPVLADGALVERLATERLEAEAATVRAEGWKWLAIELHPSYGGFGRVHPETGEDGAAVFAPEDIARAGVRITLSYDATVEVDRGLDGLKMGQHTPTYADLKRVCEATSKEGYFCFDEMFVWARALLAQQPEVAADIRARFPILLMDEVQDNSEEQASLLHAIFIAGAHPVLRQRFGDSNQAIYDSAYGEGAQTDPFPGPGKIDLPNSFRFGQKIADLSDPLAVVPQGLIGLAGAGFQPTIFLFDDASMRSVLPEYGRLLMEVFHPAENSAASFVAVSGVHTGDGEDHLPRRLGHYAPSYDASLARRAALPTTMSQYIRAGLKEALITGHTGPLVQNVSTGLLRLADIAGTPLTPSSGRNAHQRISRTLEELARPQAYQALQDYLIRNASRLTEEFWNTRLSKLVCRVVQDLSDQDPTTAASDFLAWDQPIADDAALLDAPANTYRYEKDGRSLHIRLGSIHSVKGETHDATLVLESFMRDHHLRALKAWLVGTKSGAGKASEVLKKRLRLHYVGMTRPRTLLCLAMRADSLEAADLDALEQRGWSIVTCPPFVAPEAGTHAE